MRIGVLLDPYGEQFQSGLGRVVNELVQALITQGREYSFLLYHKPLPEGTVSFTGNNWETRSLKSRSVWRAAPSVFERGTDIFLFLTPAIPIFFFPRRSVVVVHDCAHFELRAKSVRGTLMRQLLYFMYAQSFRKATSIVAVSEATQAAVERYFPHTRGKVTAIANGFTSLPRGGTDVAIQEPFFLFYGVLKPRKNVLAIIEAFALIADTHPQHLLVISGKAKGSYFDQLLELVRDRGIESRVRFIGYANDEVVGCLLARAEGLVFPSLLEGFGMPVLEAMAFGCPVITSNEGALAEVGGTAALLVDPSDPQSIASAMRRLADDPSLRTELSGKGKERAQLFSWDRAARSYLALLRAYTV